MTSSGGASFRWLVGRYARPYSAVLGLMIAFLADQAWLMGDAIVRTLIRLTLTRRHLLVLGRCSS